MAMHSMSCNNRPTVKSKSLDYNISTDEQLRDAERLLDVMEDSKAQMLRKVDDAANVVMKQIWQLRTSLVQDIERVYSEQSTALEMFIAASKKSTDNPPLKEVPFPSVKLLTFVQHNGDSLQRESIGILLEKPYCPHRSPLVTNNTPGGRDCYPNCSQDEIKVIDCVRKMWNKSSLLLESPSAQPEPPVTVDALSEPPASKEKDACDPLPKPKIRARFPAGMRSGITARLPKKALQQQQQTSNRNSIIESIQQKQDVSSIPLPISMVSTKTTPTPETSATSTPSRVRIDSEFSAEGPASIVMDGSYIIKGEPPLTKREPTEGKENMYESSSVINRPVHSNKSSAPSSPLQGVAGNFHNLSINAVEETLQTRQSTTNTSLAQGLYSWPKAPALTSPDAKRPLKSETGGHEPSALSALLENKNEDIEMGLTATLEGRDLGLSFPIGVCVFNDALCICNSGSNCAIIVKLNTAYQVEEKIYLQGKYKRPSSAAVLSGYLFVKDDVNIKKYDSDFKLLQEFSEELNRPYGLAVFRDMLITMVGCGIGRYVPRDTSLLMYSVNGQLVKTVALDIPLSVSTKLRFMDTYGNTIYISDLGASHVFAVDIETGTLIKTIGSPGRGVGLYNEPSGISCDRDGNVVVADSRANRIQVYNRFGECKAVLRCEGGLIRPSGVLVTDSDILYVVNYLKNFRIQVYDLNIK